MRRVLLPEMHLLDLAGPAQVFHSVSEPGVPFKPCATPRPGGPVMPKWVTSALIGRNLHVLLRSGRVQHLMAVLTTDHGVFTSPRPADRGRPRHLRAHRCG